MKAVLYGQTNCSAAVAVVGTWDPLLAMHEQLFKTLSDYGRRIARDSVVIMLHPPPPSFIPESPAEWPVYDDPQTRISLIKACGISATVLIDFEKEDLDAPPEEFFELLRESIKVDELWLGAHQTLGRGPDAANEELIKVARHRRIQLRRLPEMNQQRVADDVREFLRRGHVSRLVDFIGRPPVWRRPAEGKLRLAWPPGIYRCQAITKPTSRAKGTPLTVRLARGKDSVCVLKWPNDEVKWLAFVAGPTDENTRAPKSGNAAKLKTAGTNGVGNEREPKRTTRVKSKKRKTQ